uniref:Ras association domain family member 2 n=1 Tax=Dromaius novaehollandiae TaxID=8790 RepID=A0A8C4JS46_DRONO
MDYGSREYLVPCGKDKYISKNELLLHLKTYNIYYEGQNLQLRHREEDGEFIVEGLLNISWGLRRPIRLQMQDDNQRIRPPPSSSSWHSGCNLGAHGSVLKPSTLPDIQVTEAEATAGETRRDARHPAAEELPQLMRTRSDVGVRRRGSGRTAGEQRRLKRHRFSINGHFYNHKVSPLCKKIKALQGAGGDGARGRARATRAAPLSKQKLRATDYPLIARVLQGPCEQVARVFLMEKDQVEEVTYDVAQYIKFEMPVLKSFIQKLEEEEDREVKKLMRKYSVLRLMIEQRLEEIAEGPATM